MQKYLDKVTVGKFIFDSKSYQGSLSLGHSKITLTIYLDHKGIYSLKEPYPSEIHGTFFDFTKITIIDLILVDGGTYYGKTEDNRLAMSKQLVFEISYVLFSKNRITSEQKAFTAADFAVNNSNDLFRFKSFRQITHINEQLAKDLLVETENAAKRKYNVSPEQLPYHFGDKPQVFMFTGARNLAEINIPSGVLYIRNNPKSTIPSNKGFKVTNKISCYLKFNHPKDFWEVTEQINTIKNLFQLLLGKIQFVEKLYLETTDSEGVCDTSPVYHAVNNGHILTKFVFNRRLISIEHEITEFSEVINNWLLNDDDLDTTRQYYFSVFGQTIYDPDTLVKLANMFDIIPKKFYEENLCINVLDASVNEAVQSCRKQFKALPESEERATVLSALGRIGQKSLKKKILDRYRIISNSGLANLTDMKTVIDQSVDCRNYFVHGGSSKIDYIKNFAVLRFFIDTLVFIYGASELIQAGWTFKHWKPNPLNVHPFGIYIENFESNLTVLKKALR